MTEHNRINLWKMLVLTVLLGAFAGGVVWCFLKAVSLAAGLVWEVLPARTGFRYITVAACTLGGLVCGALHRRYGVYPEDLSLVMAKVKKEKHYDYHPMLIILLCAFIPLVTGASVGPEAGLTGIIAALCCWVGDNVSYAKMNAALYSEIGEAVTLGHLFHSPLFGILAVEEEGLFLQDPDQEQSDGRNVFQKKTGMSRSSKFLYYGLAAAAGFLVITILNQLFGKAMTGFPSFSDVSIQPVDYLLLALYLPAGFLAWIFFECSEKLTGRVSSHIPMIVREGFCGLALGLISLSVPMVLFSGEEQMAELMESYGSYTPFFLIGICFLKLFLTAFCIRFGLKGGHFFPLIFACVCLGIGLAMMVFPDPADHLVFAAGAVTAVTLGAQLKKPLAVSFLLLLCFPARLLFWIFLCALIGGKLAGLKHFSTLKQNTETIESNNTGGQTDGI